MNEPAEFLLRAWDDMLKLFRALGGKAENLMPRQDAAARGLFAADPAHPVWIHVPEALLVNVKDVEFVDDRIRLKPTADAMEAQRIFFEKYHNTFSWGRYGRIESMKFVAALDALPGEIRGMLAAELECEDLLEGDLGARAQKQFVRSCSVRGGEADYLVPFLDLANYSAAGLVGNFARDLDLRAEVSGSIEIAFSAHDALSAFRAFGIASAEPGAFSLPCRVMAGAPEILVERDTNRVIRRGSDFVPELEAETSPVRLSFLMIGHKKFPRLSRTIFRELMREAGYGDPDEAFDRILRFNWSVYLRFLDVLDRYEGEMIATLRRMSRFQLEAMSHCVGSRDSNTDSFAATVHEPAPAAEQVWQLSIE